MREELQIRRQLPVRCRGPLPLLTTLFFRTVIIVRLSPNSIFTQKSSSHIWLTEATKLHTNWFLAETPSIFWDELREQWPKRHSIWFIYSFKGLPSFWFTILPQPVKAIWALSLPVNSSISARTVLSTYGLHKLKVQYITWDFNTPNYPLFEFQKECSS